MKAFFIAILVTVACCCQARVSFIPDGPRPILLPTPKKVTWLDGRVILTRPPACVVNTAAGEGAVETGVMQLRERVRALNASDVAVVNESNVWGVPIWVGTRKELTKINASLCTNIVLPGEMCVPDGYVLQCVTAHGRVAVVCVGYDGRGCYYGLQTLIQLLRSDDGILSIPHVNIVDWPSFRIRLVKTNASTDNPESVKQWIDLLPRYKMNVLASQFHSKGDSVAWNKPGKTFQRNVAATTRAAVTTDTFDPLLYLSPFGKNRGSLLDPKTVDEYSDILCARICQGYKYVVVDFNDWGTYKALSADEKARFKDIGEVMGWLTNEVYGRVRSRCPEARILVCPAAGYYNGQAKPELISFCKAIPEDIFVMTTGPITRSKSITSDWLKEWTRLTGRKPFLWDNTIYCHLDQLGRLFSGTYNLNAFDVSFAKDMPKLLAGPGIHLNGGAREWWAPGVLTFLDYMWNPEAYDAKTSLHNAQTLLWGRDAPDAANDAQQKAVVFYEYLADVAAKKSTGDRHVAVTKLAEFEASVKKLAAVVGDAKVTAGLESEYLWKARGILDKVFPKPVAAGDGGAK